MWQSQSRAAAAIFPVHTKEIPVKKQKRNAVIALIVMIAIFLGAGYLSLF